MSRIAPALRATPRRRPSGPRRQSARQRQAGAARRGTAAGLARLLRSRSRTRRKAPPAPPQGLGALQEVSLSENVRTLTEGDFLLEARQALRTWEREFPLSKISGDFILRESALAMKTEDWKRAQPMLEAYCREIDASSFLPDAASMLIACVKGAKEPPASIRDIIEKVKGRLKYHPVAASSTTSFPPRSNCSDALSSRRFALCYPGHAGRRRPGGGSARAHPPLHRAGPGQCRRAEGPHRESPSCRSSRSSPCRPPRRRRSTWARSADRRTMPLSSTACRSANTICSSSIRRPFTRGCSSTATPARSRPTT